MAAQVAESYIREIVKTVFGVLAPIATLPPEATENVVKAISESLKAEGIEVVSDQNG